MRLKGKDTYITLNAEKSYVECYGMFFHLEKNNGFVFDTSKISLVFQSHN